MSNRNQQILEAIQRAIRDDLTLSRYVKQAFLVRGPDDLPNVANEAPCVLIIPASDTYTPMSLSCRVADVLLTVNVIYLDELFGEDADLVGGITLRGTMAGQRELVRLLNFNTLNEADSAQYKGATYSNNDGGLHSVILTFEYRYLDNGDSC